MEKTKTNKKLLMRAKGNDMFNHFHWLILAARKNRKNVKTIVVEPTRIIAIDGCRMHIIKELTAQAAIDEYGLEMGFYEVEKCTKKEIILSKTEKQSFPDVDKVIPSKEIYSSLELRTNDINVAVAQIIRELHPKAAINIDYIKDALATNCGSVKRVYIYKNLPCVPVLIHTDEILAIVALISIPSSVTVNNKKEGNYEYEIRRFQQIKK